MPDVLWSECLVCGGGFVDGVDDQGFDGNFLRFEQKACCLFEGCAEWREGAIGVGVGLVAEGDVVAAGEAGLVDDREAGCGGEVLGQLG
jgi:hypothetical protein